LASGNKCVSLLPSQYLIFPDVAALLTEIWCGWALVPDCQQSQQCQKSQWWWCYWGYIYIATQSQMWNLLPPDITVARSLLNSLEELIVFIHDQKHKLHLALPSSKILLRW